MTDDPRRGADVPRDPWGNPLPPEDQPPADPQPGEHPPFPSGWEQSPPAPREDVNPAWPPSASPPPPPPPHGQQGPYGQGPQAPPPYGAPGPTDQPSPYGQLPPVPPGVPAQGYGQPPAWLPRRNEGMAVGAFVCAIVGILVCGIVLEPVAIGLGIAARRRIRQSGGQLKGDGLAIAAIVIGVIAFVISVVALVVVARNPDLLDNLLDPTTTTTAGSSG